MAGVVDASRPMIVALDTNASYVTRAGTHRYIEGLRRGLRRIAPDDLVVEPFAWPVENHAYRQPARAAKTLYRELVWAKTVAPAALRRLRPDLYHNTATLAVRTPPGLPVVQTVLDAALIRFPERYRRWARWRGPARMRHAMQADRLVAISQFTADECIRLLGAPAAKFTVTPLGSDFGDPDVPMTERPPDTPLPADFLLFVGSLEPVTNLSLLRDVYAAARTRGLDLPPLVIVGSRWQQGPGEGPPPPDWHYLGSQPDETLLYLYRRARALAFPSKYEGFGLPVLEAMTLGCPVVCSPVASLPEVGGDAVWYVPHTTDAYLDALHQLATSAPLRASFRDQGLRQAAQFSWNACAEQTLAVYRQVRASD